MRPLLALFTALLVCTSAFAQTTSDPQRTTTARIVEGTVMLQRGADVRPLQTGGVLQERDVIYTGPDARVEISLSDGSTLRLGENANLELRVAPPAGRLFTAHLFLGAVWAHVHKLLQTEEFHVETENAVAGVRGTEFTVEAGREGAEDHVRVYDGAVEVRDRAGQWVQRVETGRELSIRRGLSPEGAKPFGPGSDRENKLMRWVHEQPVRTDDSTDRLQRREPQKEKRDRTERRNRLLERRVR
jgi:ferric-dicitrate binding protein FerR (iron transport regulator)